jgi:hypothetical protein
VTYSSDRRRHYQHDLNDPEFCEYMRAGCLGAARDTQRMLDRGYQPRKDGGPSREEWEEMIRGWLREAEEWTLRGNLDAVIEDDGELQ